MSKVFIVKDFIPDGDFLSSFDIYFYYFSVLVTLRRRYHKAKDQRK